MYFGADYYPEHWPEERWPTDAKLMKEAGFNVVRMAEFAWVQMEPEEGRFTFDWLHKAIDLLAGEGISAVLGTPTSAPPAWMCQKYPDMMRVDENGHRVPFGFRQHSCVNNPDVRRSSERITRAMGEEFGRHEAVIGWQIDNEFGRHCFCPVCRVEFQRWLRERYTDLDALNAAWGTTFWSQIYSDWSQIPVPLTTVGPHNPGLALDFQRFMTSSYEAFQSGQTEILRELSPGRWITHNYMGFQVELLDYRQLARGMDMASWDNYPLYGDDRSPAKLGINHDHTRGLKRQNFWVMEQQSGPAGHSVLYTSPRPGQIRLYTYQSIAHGADGIVYFRWRPCRYGIEQYWHGILDHDGSVNRRYREVSQTGAELRAISDELEGSAPVAEVAILDDFDSRFAFHTQRSAQDLVYSRHARLYYDAFHEMNIQVDVVGSDDDLSAYKLIVAPTLFVLREETADQLREFVQRGGVLITTFRTGVKDRYSRIVDMPLPGLLRDVFGVKVEEYHSPFASEDNRFTSKEMGLPESAANLWLDVLAPDTAQVIGEYSAGFAPGKPAITKNSFGAGSAIYVGTAPSQEFMKGFIERVCKDCGVVSGPVSPHWVEIVSRRKPGCEYMFVLNHNPEPAQVDSIPSGQELLSGKPVTGPIKLEPFGVAIVKRDI